MLRHTASTGSVSVSLELGLLSLSQASTHASESASDQALRVGLFAPRRDIILLRAV
jgi:hypothetical protein